MKSSITRAAALAVLSLCSTAALADPTVFNLELGTTSEDQMKSLYVAEHIGINKYSNGNMYSIPTREVSFNGVKEITVIFDTSGVLAAVLTTFPKSKFNYLNEIMDGKYRKTSEQIPFVGNKLAKYRDGETEITLDSPHMSFDMSLNYIRNDFMHTFRQRSASDERTKRTQEASQL